MQNQQKSVFIVGPTASGKSALAIEIAQKFDGEIISADSRQIFRAMPIGTGRVKRDNFDYQNQNNTVALNLFQGPRTTSPEIPGQARKDTHKPKYLQPYFSSKIAHYMLDFLSPNTVYNVAKFLKRAQKIRANVWSRGKLPIICGGTLFWAQALAENQTFPQIPPNHKLRKQLENKTAPELLAILRKLNYDRARQITDKNEQNNRIRLIRAIEISSCHPKPTCSVTLNLFQGPRTTSPEIPGQARKDTQGHQLTKQNPNTLIIALTPPKEKLHTKIAKRFDQWIADGLLDEIANLHNNLHVSWTRIESFGLEYKWGARYLRKMVTAEQMRENTLKDLRKYAKRQLTWLRRWQRQGAQISTTSSNTEAIQFAQNFLQTK